MNPEREVAAGAWGGCAVRSGRNAHPVVALVNSAAVYLKGGVGRRGCGAIKGAISGCGVAVGGAGMDGCERGREFVFLLTSGCGHSYLRCSRRAA